MRRERDPFLDRLRTMAILWVLMIHVLYWLGFFPKGALAILKSWLLIEMPLFFFITGAGLSLTEERPWGEFILRSFRRILVPYWCYALLCLLLNGLFGTAGHPLEGLHIGSASGLDVVHWLIPADQQRSELPFFTNALWYIPVYLLCVPLSPLLRRWKNRPWPVAALLVTLLLFFERQGWYYPQNVAFYSLWIYLGLHYPAIKERYIRQKHRRWELLLCALLALAFTMALCLWGAAPLDMQENKFPPGGVFLVYSLFGMCTLALAAPGLVRLMDHVGRVPVLNWGMERLSRYSLSVFLYQPLAFLLLRRLVMWGAAAHWRHSVLFVLCSVLVLPLGVLLAVVFGPLEKLGRRRKS